MWPPICLGYWEHCIISFSILEMSLQHRNKTSSPPPVTQHIQAIATLMAASALTLLSPLSKAIKTQVMGLAAVALCLAMFASPLATLSTELQTQSAVATTVNCFLWTVTGILDLKDMNDIVPNILGLVFGMAQFVFKAIYRGDSNRAADNKACRAL